jgi:hypothetical protein
MYKTHEKDNSEKGTTRKRGQKLGKGDIDTEKGT